MKILKKISLIILLSNLFVIKVDAQMENVFRIQAGTGIGFPGFNKFNGGAYKETTYNFDFKYKPLYYAIGASFTTPNRLFEFGIEFGKMNWESKVSHPDNINHGGLYSNYKIAMTFFNLGLKFIPPIKIGKFKPYISGSLVNNIYVTSYEDGYIDGFGTPVTNSTANVAFSGNLHIGTYYSITKHFFAYGEGGIGWNLLKFGLGFQLGGGDDD